MKMSGVFTGSKFQHLLISFLLQTNENRSSFFELRRSTIVRVHHPVISEFLFRNFHQNSLIIDEHLTKIHPVIDERTRNILRDYSNVVPSFIRLRIFIELDDKEKLFSFVFNHLESIDLRAIALRNLNDSNVFRQLFNDKHEPLEIRLIALQSLIPELSENEFVQFRAKKNPEQIDFYLDSLIKKSSISFRKSGSYRFPFGKINVIFNDDSTRFFPQFLQFEFQQGQVTFEIFHFRNSKISSVSLEKVFFWTLKIICIV